jgi:hypothetical protein
MGEGVTSIFEVTEKEEFSRDDLVSDNNHSFHLLNAGE